MADTRTPNNNPVMNERELSIRSLIDRTITESPFSNCIAPLLTALDWPGEEHHLVEALPHFERNLGLHEFLNLFKRLDYDHKILRRAKPHRLDPRLFPCLFVAETGETLLLLRMSTENQLIVYDGQEKQERILEETLTGTTYVFTRKEEKYAPLRRRNTTWFGEMMQRYRGLFGQVLTVGIFMNILGLAVPIFIMMVYDLVITANSKTMLFDFLLGAGLALMGIQLLQTIRSKILAFVGARLDAVLGNAIFERLLYLSPSYTESATVGAQVSRLKDFETIRDFVTGPVISVFLDLPFTIIFLLAIGVIGGAVVYIPTGIFLAYLIVLLILHPKIQLAILKNTQVSAKRQSFIIEAMDNMRAIKLSGAEKTWQDRYKNISAESNVVNYRTTILTAVTNSLSDVLMILAGVGTLALGVIFVLKGDMTTGALIAVMMFVWRVLSPLRVLFSVLTRVDQIRGSIKQINQLMNIRPEHDPEQLGNPLTHVEGNIKFIRASLRYSNDADPAIMGVSFEVKPKELVVVVGRNGAGKSTLLKMIANLYTPQSGSVRLDDRDIRQFDPIELRRVIGYLPQRAQFFYGTIAQNLRLANPIATNEDIKEACELAGVYGEIMAFPEQFETRIKDQWQAQVSDSFQQRLSLARVYIKKAPILLLDEPLNGLDARGEAAFLAAMQKLRGKATIFIVAHQTQYVEKSDRILFLHEGNLVAEGPTETLLPKLPKEFL